MRTSALVLATACSINAGLDLPYDVPELTVPGTTYGQEAPFSFYIDLDQQQEPHVSGVSSMTLTSITFQITKDSGCFDFIEDVTLWIASTKTGSSLERTVVATGTGPGCVDTIALTPTAVDLAPYLAEGASITATGKGVPPKNSVSFDGHVVLHAIL